MMPITAHLLRLKSYICLARQSSTHPCSSVNLDDIPEGKNTFCNNVFLEAKIKYAYLVMHL
jgi:hypothetical protein